MIDTLHIRLETGNYDSFAMEQLINCRKEVDEETGQVICYSGRYKNFRIRISKEYMRIQGSLSEYYFNNNIYSLNFNQIVEAIDLLGQELKINLKAGIITRLDLAETLIVERKVKDYFVLLGEKKSFRRSIHSNTLYYTNENRTICFYDKKKQIAQSGKAIPPKLRAKNLMRFEVRYKPRYIIQLEKHLNIHRLGVSHLMDFEIYSLLVSKWEKEYEEIFKNDQTAFNLDKVKSAKEFVNQYALKGMESEGGIGKVLEGIEYSKSFSSKSPVFISRLKKKVKDISKSGCKTFQSNQIEELNMRIKDAVQLAIKRT